MIIKVVHGMEEAKERTYALPVTEAEAAVILRALDEYVEDTPLNTSTAERLHRKTELLHRCIQKETELSDACAELMEYAGIDFNDND